MNIDECCLYAPSDGYEVNHGGAISSLLYATPPPSRNGPKGPNGGGGALEGGWMDGWMERKHSGGRIPRTQAMKPKLRAHDSDRFTVLGQAASGVGWAVTAPQAPCGASEDRDRTQDPSRQWAVTVHRAPPVHQCRPAAPGPSTLHHCGQWQNIRPPK